MVRDFLLEIGAEELPASACEAVIDLLPGRVFDLFQADNVGLTPEQIQVLASPRRIAVLIRDLPESQTPREQVQRGPAAEAAFDAQGNPTQAALGFARAKGVRVEDLAVREEAGRRFVYLVSRSEARPVFDLLPDICVRIVRDMYFPKNMRWGSRELRFARPIRWLVALFGQDVVPFSLAGLNSGRVSLGHRYMGGPVSIACADEYREAMGSVKVMVDHCERESFLRDELTALAEARKLDWVDPTRKMDEVKFLVEWPTVLEGSFAEEHLRLPAEVLITAMQSHQRYFPLVDRSDGSLARWFLFASNSDPAFAAEVTTGNERVLEGRIEDAEFSFDKDLATGIEQMAVGLSKVVFHEKVGTMRDKTERLVALTGYLADHMGLAEEVRSQVLEAARLSKADQVSIMVREFADLEGTMGETYARLEGYHENVARAIREQFLPDAAGGDLPRTQPGALLATAEKIDNIVAAFATGEPPTGSKDPYGLRRAATGMVNIAFKHGFAYDVRELAGMAYEQIERFPHLVPSDTVVSETGDFILDRLARVLMDNGLTRESVDAVLPTSHVFLDLRKRAAALDAFRQAPAWEDLVVVFSRPFNLSKKLPLESYGAVDPALFQEEAEGVLYERWRETEAKVESHVAAGDYPEALMMLAALRPCVDRYFDDVLVMAEDEAARINRLRLLQSIAAGVRELAYLERIPG